MKRVCLTIVFLFTAGIMVFAQMTPLDPTSRPTSAQTTETARGTLDQARSNATQFDSSQAELIARNTSNNDRQTYERLNAEIARLAANINSEQNRLANSLDRGIRVNPEAFDRIQQLIDQHKAKVAELEAFTSRR